VKVGNPVDADGATVNEAEHFGAGGRWQNEQSGPLAAYDIIAMT